MVLLLLLLLLLSCRSTFVLQVIFIAIFCSGLVFGTAFFIWRRKAKEQMRNEVKAILADYMQLDDVGNEEGDNARMLEMGSDSSVGGRI